MNVAHIDDEIIPFVSRFFRPYARIVSNSHSHIGLSTLALMEYQAIEEVKCGHAAISSLEFERSWRIDPLFAAAVGLFRWNGQSLRADSIAGSVLTQ